MPIQVEKLGPGSLDLGAGPLAAEIQMTGGKLVCSENVKTEDAVKVLSGDELPESSTETFTWTLQGEFLQSLLAAGVVAWSWTNAGTEQAFVFTPNGGGASFSGILKPVPLQVGGDEVGARMVSSFTWRLVGEPIPDWT